MTAEQIEKGGRLLSDLRHFKKQLSDLESYDDLVLDIGVSKGDYGGVRPLFTVYHDKKFINRIVMLSKEKLREDIARIEKEIENL